ncbi:hypothetical protein Q8G35_15890 [Peribacillus simplex]|uniref:Uncharacterized protein n=2 Tax=Peribacillus TaxID=2675229 RepID=A0AA90T7T9_9BACI|nr:MULTISPECIES: hypothetical protein [Peribacillus]MDP1419832.1 hypothetical protein [Peribacillus simplex]MDP1453072.1 hypothetical protein [Peribacillus frigoritolerans]
MNPKDKLTVIQRSPSIEKGKILFNQAYTEEKALSSEIISKFLLGKKVI